MEIGEGEIAPGSNDGNANALLGSFCLATLRVGAKLHDGRGSYKKKRGVMLSG